METKLCVESARSKVCQGWTSFLLNADRGSRGVENKGGRWAWSGRWGGNSVGLQAPLAFPPHCPLSPKVGISEVILPKKKPLGGEGGKIHRERERESEGEGVGTADSL